MDENRANTNGRKVKNWPNPFRELGFGTISMHAGITAITELAVKNGLTNRLRYLAEIISEKFPVGLRETSLHLDRT